MYYFIYMFCILSVLMYLCFQTLSTACSTMSDWPMLCLLLGRSLRVVWDVVCNENAGQWSCCCRFCWQLCWQVRRSCRRLIRLPSSWTSPDEKITEPQEVLHEDDHTATVRHHPMRRSPSQSTNEWLHHTADCQRYFTQPLPILNHVRRGDY